MIAPSRSVCALCGLRMSFRRALHLPFGRRANLSQDQRGATVRELEKHTSCTPPLCRLPARFDMSTGDGDQPNKVRAPRGGGPREKYIRTRNGNEK